MSPRIVILTGAGISAESGLSTFRDANGLWENHRIEDVASATGFQMDPELVQRFYDLRRRQAREVRPNAAHMALARLGRALGDGLLIVTQNVDDLHERAGKTRVLHVHGELNSALCTACGARHHWTADLIDDPPCPSCGERTLRPDIVWFGELPYRMDQAQAAAAACELFVVIGTSGVVYPAAGLASIARAHSARTVLLNLEDHSDSDSYDEVRLGTASDVVAEWVAELLHELGADDAFEEDARDEGPKGFHIGGWDVGIVRFEFKVTYRGWVEGYPNRDMNLQIVEWAVQDAQKVSPGVAIQVIEPQLRYRDSKGAHKDFERLPEYRCIVSLESMWDAMTVVWFQDGLPLQIDSEVREQIEALPWDSVATVVRTSYDDF